MSSWKARWQEELLDYDGYLDSATKVTQQALQKGLNTASESNDLAGAARIAPLLLAPNLLSESARVEAARAQTAMTHGDAQVIDAAEYFMRLTCRILAGESMNQAMAHLRGRSFGDLPLEAWTQQAEDLLQMDTTKALVKLGLNCHMEQCFPSTMYLLLKHGDDLQEALLENVMAGGDSAARGMILGMVLGARHTLAPLPSLWLEQMEKTAEIQVQLNDLRRTQQEPSRKLEFPNAQGDMLAARLEHPEGEARAFAVFAHCFTCGKDIAAASRISRALSKQGYAVLRFDFTGLGNSDGDFSNSSFSSNIEDLIAAVGFLKEQYTAPDLLVGHSLGGAAVLAAATQLPDLKGVVTIGAPYEASHLRELLKPAIPELEAKGDAEIDLAGRSFHLKKQFLDDIDAHKPEELLKDMRADLLIFHSPVDTVVPINNAGNIFSAAKHPKSFISLNQADHLLQKSADSQSVADMIAAWAGRFVE